MVAMNTGGANQLHHNNYDIKCHGWHLEDIFMWVNEHISQTAYSQNQVSV